MLFRASIGLVVFATLVAAQNAQVPLGGSWQFEDALGFHNDLEDLRLVRFSLAEEAKWITEREKLDAKALGWDYMDITETPFLGVSEKPQFSYPPPNSTAVPFILAHLCTTEPKANLEHLTSYYTRYYNSDTGLASSEWLYSKILSYTEQLASDKQRPLISVDSVQHSWKQNSIIVRITPPNTTKSGPITILGAHIDSINHENPFLAAPGAGDDGSGTVTILEAYRALLVAGYIPISPLEFHFYAGEEGGLLGSQAIASSYELSEKVIRGMIQFDMTSFHKAGTRAEIAVISNEDQVDAPLSEFMILLIERYLEIPWVKEVYPPRSRSDHVSWKIAGYQTCHPIEGRLKNGNPYIHGAEDKLDVSAEFSFEHMLHFMKLGVAFAVEMTSY